MDTGENKLSVEMMKEMYESYKLHQKEDYEKFVEDCKKIIQVSDRGCPDTEDILKLVEGKVITDDHNRRLTDPSLFKLRGRQILFSSFDEPYPVMTSKDEKMMRGMSDEIRKKFQDYFEYEIGIPRETITIDSIPENVREEAERESLLYGDCYILTGATKNFKMQQTYDNLEALYDILNAEGPDRNGRIWKREALKFVDILKVNQSEAEMLTGETDCRKTCITIARWGVREVLLTLGDRGCMLFHDGTFYEIAALQPREIVDATGCGDSFVMGYIFQRAFGASVLQAGRFATAISTIKLEHHGPFRDTYEEAIKRMSGQ